jgi:hypothetical protein
MRAAAAQPRPAATDRLPSERSDVSVQNSDLIIDKFLDPSLHMPLSPTGQSPATPAEAPLSSQQQVGAAPSLLVLAWG